MAIIATKRPDVRFHVLKTPWRYLSAIASGMALTMRIMLRQLFRLEKSETLEWPEQPATYGPRFKGRHILTKREDGQIRCTACFLCATACPAHCIHIEAGENKDHGIEKYPIRFEIDILRCVFCGYCEEACPVDAIRLGPEYAITGTAEAKWVFTKEYLSERPQLAGGCQSKKDENVKHPTIDHDPSFKERRTQVPH